MFSEKGLKRLTGFLYLFILATSALSGGLAVEHNTDPDQMANILRNITEDPEKYRISITFDLVSHMAIIAIASALYLTFNKYNRQLALFGTLCRVVEGIIMVFTEINNLVLLGVAENYLSATGTKAETLETTAQGIILMENWGVTFGLAFLALGALAYNILFISSKAVPQPLGWIGVVASILGIVGTLLGLVIPELLIVLTIGIIIMMLYELTLGIWLIRSGNSQNH
jgi:hypothetical protein